jgi:hypothetical protein
VKDGTLSNYTRSRDRFLLWLSASAIELVVNPLLDAPIADYMMAEYLKGESADVGSTLLAAMAFFYPDLDAVHGSIKLPLARQALKGWRRLCPAVSRLAWPEELVFLIALEILCLPTSVLPQATRMQMCLATIFAMGCYWRPSETLGLRVCDCIATVVGAPSHEAWSFRLHPFERGVCSKTREFDDSVMVDLPPFKEFTKWLPKLIAGRDPMAPLFDFTAGMWGQMVTRVLANLQIDRKFVLYLLRHSGASNDAFHKRRTIQEIKRRGRWLSDRSVRRYE